MECWRECKNTSEALLGPQAVPEPLLPSWTLHPGPGRPLPGMGSGQAGCRRPCKLPQATKATVPSLRSAGAARTAWPAALSLSLYSSS